MVWHARSVDRRVDEPAAAYMGLFELCTNHRLEGCSWMTPTTTSTRAYTKA